MTAATSQFVRTWRLAIVALCAVTVLAFSQSAWAVLEWNANNPPANGYTVQQVIDAGGLRIGDKVFSSFNITNTTSGGAIAPNASSISISGFFTDDGGIGISFTGAWFANINQSINTNMTFAVTADTPNAITGIDLSLDAVGTLGNGVVSIAEQARDQQVGGNVLTNPTLTVLYQAGNPLNKFQDATSIDPHNTIWVTKDISVLSGGVGIAHLSKFTQVYHQVPEPGTLALAGLGLLAMAHGRRRNRNRDRV